MQTFSSDSPLNFVQKFLVIASESEEEFDFSPYNVAAGVNISNTLDILEKISYFRSDPFALLIYIFQQIPTGLHAPIFRILKKEKTVHLPSQRTTLLDMI